MDQAITTTAAYKAAETYERFIVSGTFRYWTPILLERALPGPGERVLDVACGTGIVARSVLPLVKPGGKVTGLDINPAMLAVACKQSAEQCHEIDWQEGNAESMPFPDGCFDLVLCQQGLQFFKDRLAAAQGMQRVLRKGGRISVEVWQGLDAHPFYQEFNEAIASTFHIPIEEAAAPFAFGDPYRLANLFEDAGFQQVRVEVVSQAGYFADPDLFVEMAFTARKAVMPAYRNIHDAVMAELRETVNRKVAHLIQENTVDGTLVIPLRANIATGVC